MDEIKQMLKILLDRSEYTNAKLEGIELRLANLEGSVKGLHDELGDLSNDVD